MVIQEPHGIIWEVQGRIDSSHWRSLDGSGFVPQLGGTGALPRVTQQTSSRKVGNGVVRPAWILCLEGNYFVSHMPSVLEETQWWPFLLHIQEFSDTQRLRFICRVQHNLEMFKLNSGAFGVFHHWDILLCRNLEELCSFVVISSQLSIL